MPPAISEAEFNEELGRNGLRVVRPGDDGFVVWGYVDVGNGVLVNRWQGGATLASQLKYLIEQGASAPPPAQARVKKTEAPKKKGKKSNVSK